MWKFNPFTPREPSSLEGRFIDVGNVKVHVRNAIAEGGFSCVYLARDAVHASRQYALKHIICNDEDSLDLVMKEVSVMKLLRGHPNVITLVAHTILEVARTKEALLLMEFCDKSLVNLLEKRGAAYFEEKQILLMFRDVCNAVFSMHSQSPPVAHRDLKAENILLGSNGTWKLCDFGSTSTNHKCFDRPEEMGIEEDNIRKHTTPAYRAPEMWDLYRKEFISEKVDIWALGCLLYRICYFKSAFDGESKLQILNGNYCIPEVPKYSSSITQLIKDMLEASPDSRPDITQVWFRVNEQLPTNLQKHLPDGPPVSAHPHTASFHEGIAKKTSLMAQRIPPQSSSKERMLNLAAPQGNQVSGRAGSPSNGAFWFTHHLQDINTSSLSNKPNTHTTLPKMPDSRNPSQTMQPETKATTQSEPCSTFIADFDTSRLNLGSISASRTGKAEEEAEVCNLMEQLKQANLEKAELISQNEKLSALCHSQRQEIQELKRALAAVTPLPQMTKDPTRSHISPPNIQIITPERPLAAATPLPQSTKDSTWSQISPLNEHMITPQSEKLDGGLLELEQAMLASMSAPPCPSPQTWQSFD